MTSKQKIMVSVIGIVMVLAIIGLTIGLVLTATQVTASSSMNVSFTSKEVDATIAGAAKYYAKGEGDGVDISTTGSPVTFTAGTEKATDTITFAEQVFANPTDSVIYTFIVTNTAAEGAKAIDAYYNIIPGTNATIEVSTNGTTYNAVATGNIKFTGDTGIAANNGKATLYVKVTVNNKALDMKATGAMNITLIQTDPNIA